MFRFIYMAALVVLLMLAAGCTDRGSNPDRPDPAESGLEPGMHHVMSDAFIVQVGNRTSQLPFTVYWPDVSYFIPGAGSEEIPLLILLAPEGETKNFYIQHGLPGIADRLIADGEIDPMAIVMFENKSAFGGHFYAGNKSNGAGKWDRVFGEDLIPYLETRYSTNIYKGDPGKRGIGGFGQGAYGAYRATIINDSLFGSVSGADGPLDFDGPNGDGGLIHLMDSVFVEQPNLTAETFRRSPPVGFDTSSTRYPISQMFAGGAMAFSPMYFNLDSFITYSVSVDTQSILNLRINDTWPDTSRYYCLGWDTVVVGTDTSVFCADSFLVEGETMYFRCFGGAIGSGECPDSVLIPADEATDDDIAVDFYRHYNRNWESRYWCNQYSGGQCIDSSAVDGWWYYRCNTWNEDSTECTDSVFIPADQVTSADDYDFAYEVDSAYFRCGNWSVDGSDSTCLDSIFVDPDSVGGGASYDFAVALRNLDWRMVKRKFIIDTIPRLQPEFAMVDENGDPLYPNFLIDSIVTQDAFNLEFLLPFGWDQSGVLQKPYQPIWSMWMDDNLDSLLLNGGSLDGVDCWVGTSTQAKWAYHQMTESWISFLQAQGLTPAVYRYTGYEGYPATGSQYVYDVLEQMLKFHSASFKD